MSKTLTFREGIREVLFSEMEQNDDMIMLGENFRYKGSLFSQVLTPAFRKKFGALRVMETAVAENAIIGVAFGAALAGMTAVPEIYSADFLFCVGTEVVNDIPKWRYQHQYKEPINYVVRGAMGLHAAGGGGPEHSQCPEAYFHNTPGLVIAAPGTVSDAMGLLRTSLRLGDPVIYLEHRKLYDLTEKVDVPDDYMVPIGKGNIVKEGTDITIVAWAYMLQEAKKAVEKLEQDGIFAELVDPRTIKPMDFDLIVDSAKKTGNLLIVEETPQTGSISGEIIVRTVTNNSAVKCDRLTMPDVPYHYNAKIEAATVPKADTITAHAKKMLGK